ncbi:MAG: 30S ribosomal protein S6 [Deltaproteobacteria bacterium]|jgi:small subunit ribosomal protein S6|nr:30S ribosomal protein S6 [Deltaproteobacteria bacterium]
MYFRRYETYILLSPNLMSEQIDAFKEKVQGILDKGQAQIISCEEKGRMKLAYPVKKEFYGFYILYDYRAKAEVASEFERNLKIDEQVFKYLTIVLDKNFTEEKYQNVLDNLANEAAKKEKSQQSQIQGPYLASQSSRSDDSYYDDSEDQDEDQQSTGSDDSDHSDQSPEHEDLIDEEPFGETK